MVVLGGVGSILISARRNVGRVLVLVCVLGTVLPVGVLGTACVLALGLRAVGHLYGWVVVDKLPRSHWLFYLSTYVCVYVCMSIYAYAYPHRVWRSIIVFAISQVISRQ